MEIPGNIESITGIDFLTALPAQAERTLEARQAEHIARAGCPVPHGNTILHFAAVQGHKVILEMLLENGANANTRNE